MARECRWKKGQPCGTLKFLWPQLSRPPSFRIIDGRRSLRDGPIFEIGHVHMKPLSALVVVLGSVLALIGNVSAQDIPPGSYQKTCMGVDADWHRLSATCRTMDRGWNYSTLENYRSCLDDIVNNDGHLACQDVGPSSGDDDWAPRGSYMRSCREIQEYRQTLVAECQDRTGRWRYTELVDYRSCRGDIGNNDGMLVCRRNAYEGDDDVGAELPRGSWRWSCRNYHVYGGVLYAECRDQYGRFFPTSINVKRCRREISNLGGRLICGEMGAAGVGIARIVLYKHSNYGGRSRSYSRDVADLNADGFGNVASSAVVQSGVWQLCDRPNFRGYCVVLDRTQPSLRAFGFDDRVESVRRVR